MVGLFTSAIPLLEKYLLIGEAEAEAVLVKADTAIIPEIPVNTKMPTTRITRQGQEVEESAGEGAKEREVLSILGVLMEAVLTHIEPLVEAEAVFRVLPDIREDLGEGEAEAAKLELTVIRELVAVRVTLLLQIAYQLIREVTPL